MGSRSIAGAGSDHAVAWSTAATSPRKARLPKGWASIRRRILERDEGICHVCHRGGADQVDHVVPGDDHSDGNLAAIHDDPCHRAKSSAEGAAARPKRKREVERHPGLI